VTQIGGITTALSEAETAAQSAETKISSLGNGLQDESLVARIKKIVDALGSVVSKTIRIGLTDAASRGLKAIQDELAKIRSKTVTVTTKHVSTGSSGGEEGEGDAYGTSNAMGGRTLVGELGPELLVHDGMYSILGASGAEFVNLSPGDIVFDANKTKKILNGQPGARGTAMAGGGVVGMHGPALSTGL